MSKLLEWRSCYILDAFGLSNFSGRHCFWNSILQSLMSCPQLLTALQSNKTIPVNSFIFEFYMFMTRAASNKDLYDKFMQELSRLKKSSSVIANFSSNQQCVSETFIYIMEMIETAKIIYRLFEHREYYTIICATCDNESKTTALSPLFTIEPTTKLSSTLMNSIEQISEYDCPNCKTRGIAARTRRLAMLPECIAITVKKYSWEGTDGKKKNIQSDFPEYLTISPLRFRAVAYIDHYGSLHGGHYVSTCLRNVNNNISWVHCNDDAISPGSFNPNENTYMVFYSYVDKIFT
jgi:ubiquitin C-terminal hydrolase